MVCCTDSGNVAKIKAINNSGYWEGRCNRLHTLFQHYSTVRMTILAFLVPLGGMLIANEKRKWAGCLVIAMAYLLNLLFSSRAMNRWLMHKNIDLWLERINPHKKDDQKLPLYYQAKIPCYCQVMSGAASQLVKSSSAPTATSPQAESETGEIQGMRDEWIKVLDKAREFEWILQAIVLLGIGAFLTLLFLFP